MFEWSGIYIVKLEYRALVIQKEGVALEEGMVTETSGNNQEMWIALSKMNVVPKVQIF